jgi:hypothetical protein
MAIDPESLYMQLGHHIQTMPDLANGPITNEKLTWLGKAYALVSATGQLADAEKLRIASDRLPYAHQDMNQMTIISVLHRALAVAELKAPVASRGAFIPAGMALTLWRRLGRSCKLQRETS